MITGEKLDHIQLETYSIKLCFEQNWIELFSAFAIQSGEQTLQLYANKKDGMIASLWDFVGSKVETFSLERDTGLRLVFTDGRTLTAPRNGELHSNDYRIFEDF